MKTLDEIKDEVAKEHGLIDWDEVIHVYGYVGKWIDEVCKRYARECCKASLGKASENATISCKSQSGVITEAVIDRQSIKSEDNIVL